MFRAVLLSALLIPLASGAQTEADTTLDAALAATLGAIYESDQGGRMEWRRIRESYNGAVPDSARTAFWDAQTRIDEANFVRVDSIVSARGWPSPAMAGEQGSLAAFLVVQHAPLEAQQRYLPILTAAVEAGAAEPWHLAYLTDRVLWRTDRPQRYGSQYRLDPETNARTYEPIEDLSQLNARRAEIGMGPHPTLSDRTDDG
ncbi:MAG: DUF6624 domain-containing protein [Bacteroidota bacterium]